MINFNKNKLINETLNKFYDTFSHTLNTADYVPEKFNMKICKYIFKNMKIAFRKIDREDRKFQRALKKKTKDKLRLKKYNEKLKETELKKQSKVNEQNLNADSNNNS